jgi:hypothetical protein
MERNPNRFPTLIKITYYILPPTGGATAAVAPPTAKVTVSPVARQAKKMGGPTFCA